MPDLRPFHALRYTDAAGEPADLLAPPYDVIEPGRAGRLRERSPFNAVRLVLPTGEGPYRRAGSRLRDWRADGLLRREEEPSLRIYAQSFEHRGREMTRYGLFAALRLTEFAAGEVVPHEETHREPKEDRLRLTEACDAQLSPVFLVAPDPADRIPALAERAVQGTPELDARTPDGVRHRLWRVPPGPLAEELCEAAGQAPALIADGHHRYETALAVRRRRPADPSAAWTLACVVSRSDPGLLCLPTHRALSRAPDRPGGPSPAGGFVGDGEAGSAGRVQGGGAGAAAGAWRGLLEDSFEVRSAGLDRNEPDAAARRAAEEGGGALVAVPPEGPCLRLRALRRAREAAALEPHLSDVPPAVFDRLVLRPGFDRGPDAAVEEGLLSYHRDARDAVEAAGEAGAAFLLPPLPVDRVLELARSGIRLPPKSTYFWPKLPSGLVFRTLGSRTRPDAEEEDPQLPE